MAARDIAQLLNARLACTELVLGWMLGNEGEE